MFGDLFATWFSHENLVFCIIWVFFRTSFKNFSFSLASLTYSYSCFSFPLSKSPCSHTKSPYSPSPLQEQVWVLFLSHYISHFLQYFSWIVCFGWYLCLWCLNMGIWSFREIVMWLLLVMCFYTLSLAAQCVICSTHTFCDMIMTLILWF